MYCYHRTYHADEILTGGFRDGTGLYLTSQERSGVWLSDRPLDANEGARGDTLLRLEIPDYVLTPYEWVEDDKMYREFLIPADVVNRYGPPTLVDEYADES